MKAPEYLSNFIFKGVP